MVELFVYYQKNNNSFYYTSCSSNLGILVEIGKHQRFNDVLIQIFVIRDNQVYDYDYYNKLRKKEKEKQKLKEREKRLKHKKRKQIITMLINHIIDLLYKLKSKFDV